MSGHDRAELLRRRELEEQRAFAALLVAAPHRPLDAERAATDLGRDAGREALALLGIEVPERPAHDPAEESSATDPLARLANRAARAGALVRRVRVDPDWERGLLLPVLAIADGLPVVLTPGFPSARMVDPRTGRAIPRRVRGTVGSEGLLAVDELPARARLRDLVDLSGRGNRPALILVAVLTLLAGGVSVLLPLASGLIVSRIVPDDDTPRLIALVTALVLATVASAGLQIAQGHVLATVRSRSDIAVGDAVWRRLLLLPASFHARYTTADLADRADAIDDLRQAMGAAFGSGLVSIVVAVSSVLVLFSANPAVGGVALAAVAVQGVIVLWTQKLRTAVQRRELQAVADRDGLMLQVVAAIARVRVSAAENRVFTQLARRFAKLRLPQHEDGELLKRNQTVAALWPVLGVLIVTVGVVVTGTASTGLGTYIVLTTAIAQVLAATATLFAVIAGLVGVLPQLERLTPILTAIPETAHSAALDEDLRLTGAVALEHVTFRYDGDATGVVLDDVSFEVDAGEFVAIVGPSGSGKSTILRLLLGFEEAEAGSVRFDGRDLRQLPRQAVRRRIGTVLQTASLFPGSIADNISAGRLLSRDRIWAAAEAAAVADDIRAMPMGLETPLVEGAASISGGQRQRIVIARALAGEPDLMFFDEATSALDNLAQQTVSASISARRVTRIVIAHRLSTVRDADRIVVLDHGRVVQNGTYDELMAAPGLFRDLANRQLVG